MAINDPSLKFTFDFAQLRRAPPPELRLLPARLEPLPAGAAAITPVARPRWLPPLLPVFRTCEPLRVSVLSAEAPVWAWRLRSSLAALFASAGTHASAHVSEWPDGFAVGTPGFEQVPATPHAVVIAAECDGTSMRAAAQLMSLLERERCLVAVHGDEPALDRSIGLDARSAVRFPLVGRSELAALGRGLSPGLTNSPFARACFGLARTIVGRYRDMQA